MFKQRRFKRSSLREIKVVAGILQKGDEILIAQRAESHHEGKWEFPGGKVDHGETPEQALIRELHEELDLTCDDLEFFCESKVELTDKTIVLLTYNVKSFSGHAISKVHAQLHWVKPEEFSKYVFLDADIPVIEKLISHI